MGAKREAACGMISWSVNVPNRGDSKGTKKKCMEALKRHSASTGYQIRLRIYSDPSGIYSKKPTTCPTFTT